MDGHVYSIIEIVGTSSTGLEGAIRNGVETAAKTMRHLDWFEVGDIRGHLRNGKVEHYQVQMKVGLRYEANETGATPNGGTKKVQSSARIAASKGRANPLTMALSRWDNEGGAPAPTAAESASIIRHLGAAVLAQWSTLPREAQRDLFDAASDMDEPDSDPETFRQQMAVFLHHNKNREQETIDTGGEGGGIGAG